MGAADCKLPEQRKDIGAQRRTVCPLRLGLARQAMPPSSDSQGLPSHFQGAQPPLCSPSPPLTSLSMQDPFVEPIFTWGEGGKGRH